LIADVRRPFWIYRSAQDSVFAFRQPQIVLRGAIALTMRARTFLRSRSNNHVGHCLTGLVAGLLWLGAMLLVSSTLA
jgi:hypothetical protein